MASKDKFHPIKRKDGLYMAYYWINLLDGSKKRKAVYDRDKKALREKWRNVVADNIKNAAVDSQSLTVASYLMDWVENTVGIKETTRKGYGSVITNHIIPRIGKIRLSSLTTARIQGMIREIVKDGNSVRTTQFVKIILSQVLEIAEDENLVRPNLMRHVKLESYTPEERKVWNLNEGRKFREIIEGEKYQFFYEMYITYGLRRGEAIALKWKDIDFKEKVIHIKREAIVDKGGPIISTLKTEDSERDLPLIPCIAKLLNNMRSINQKPDDYILSNEGKLISPDSVSRRFRVIVRNAGLPDVVLHSLRHFVATTLKNAGVEPTDAQKILGHSTPATTMKFYQHSHMEDKRRAYDKFMDFTDF